MAKNLARNEPSGTLLGGEEEVSYPTLWLSGSQVEALGLWAHDIGGTTKMTATIRIASKSQDSGDERRVTIELVDADVKRPEGINADRMFPSVVSDSPAPVTK